MGYLYLICVARQEASDGTHTLYGLSYGIRKGDNRIDNIEPEQHLLLVKSNAFAGAIDKATWTLEHAIPRDSLHYLRSGTAITKILCTVDAAGAFTMMIFDSSKQPFVSRYEPAVAINATYQTEPQWWNVGIAVNYRYNEATSYLFNVPQLNNTQSMVYHASLDEGNTLAFGFLNPSTRQMESSSTTWNLSSVANASNWRIEYNSNIIYALSMNISGIRLTRIYANLTQGGIIPPMPTNLFSTAWPTSERDICFPTVVTALNDNFFALCPGHRLFVSRSNSWLVLQPTPWNKGHFGIAMPGRLVGGGRGGEGSDLGSAYIALFESVQDSRYISSVQNLSGIAVTEQGEIYYGTGGSRIAISEEYGIREVNSSIRREPSWEEPVVPSSGPGLTAALVINVAIIFLLCGLNCFRRHYTWRDGYIKRCDTPEDEGGSADGDGRNDSEGIGQEDEEGDVSHYSDEEAVSQKQPENDDDEPELNIELRGKISDETIRQVYDKLTTTQAGEEGADRPTTQRRRERGDNVPMSVIVSPVAAPMVTSPTADQQWSDAGQRVRKPPRQRIVLSNHPRPNIITTIDQVGAQDDGDDEEDVKDDETIEDWEPRPFDPRAQIPPPPLPLLSNAGRTLAEPTAPPQPPLETAQTESFRDSLSVPMPADDESGDVDDEPPPSYESGFASQPKPLEP